MLLAFGGVAGCAGVRAYGTAENCKSAVPMRSKARNETMTMDLAQQTHRLMWSIHSAVGEASFDNFERIRGNPIYTGAPPYEWPVNGFLFQDPNTGSLNVYVGLYPRGYTRPGFSNKCLLLQAATHFGPWQNKGVVMQGSPTTFDGNGKDPGNTPDSTIVYDRQGYHMIYDWSGPNRTRDQGLGYAHADRPEGPFKRDARPLVSSSKLPLMEGIFGSVYGGTLFKRDHDWLILAATSTGGKEHVNAGGTWGLVGMVAREPQGPYSQPKLFLYPQSKVFFPAPLEFFPAFSHDGYAYVPATCLANRNIQIIFRAKLADALSPEAWKVFEYGSFWHAEPVPNEDLGMWGQTFSGIVQTNGTFLVMFPSKNAHNLGTINLAERPWNIPYKDGFAVSASEAPSLTDYQRDFSTFDIQATVRANGPKTIVWSHKAPFGVDRVWHAGGRPHKLTLASHTAFSLSDKGWQLRTVAADGAIHIMAEGNAVQSRGMTADAIGLRQETNRLVVTVNNRELWHGDLADGKGRIGILASKGSTVFVDHLISKTPGTPTTLSLLPSDGIAGAGNGDKGWTKQEDKRYRYGFGYVSESPGVFAKWNYRGCGFALWSPRSFKGGQCEVWLDGDKLADVDMHEATTVVSARVFEKWDVPFGCHTVTIVRKTGALCCDSLDFDVELKNMQQEIVTQ